MKIAILYEFMELKGGGERLILELMKNFDATLFTCNYDPERSFEEFKGMDIQVIGENKLLEKSFYKRGIQRLKNAKAFSNLVVEKEFDVVNPINFAAVCASKHNNCVYYCNSPPRALYDLAHLEKNLLKKMITFPINQYFRHLDSSSVHRCKSIISNSRNIRDRVKKYYGLDSSVIYPGVESKDYYFSDPEPFVFYAGRLDAHKRAGLIIESMKNVNKNVKLKIAGQGIQEKMLKEQAKSIEGGRIEFLGVVSDSELKDLYSKCLAAVYVPIDEDFGLVPIEAMASGKPVIAVNEGGPKETVVDGKTGYLVEANPEEIASKINYLYENPGVPKEMKSACLKRAQEFDWSVFVKKMKEEFENNLMV